MIENIFPLSNLDIIRIYGFEREIIFRLGGKVGSCLGVRIGRYLTVLCKYKSFSSNSCRNSASKNNTWKITVSARREECSVGNELPRLRYLSMMSILDFLNTDLPAATEYFVEGDQVDELLPI